jgi:hypothetical protein
MLSINILLCPFKISAGITCMSFVRNACFPNVAFNSGDLGSVVELVIKLTR